MSESEKVSRRRYMKYVGGIVVVAVVAAAGYGIYEATKPTPTPTPVPTPTPTTPTPTPTPTPTKKPTLHVLGFSFPPILALEQFIPEFEEEFGVDVVIETGFGWEELCSKIMLDVGTPGVAEYDVWAITADFRLVFPHCLPLDEYMKATDHPERLAIEDYVPLALKAGKLNGKQVWFGAPVTWHIVYRTDLFEKYGVRIPKTTDELLDAAKKLKYVVGQAFADPQTFSTFGWLKAFGGQWIDPLTYEPEANTPEAIDFMTWWNEMYKTMPPAAVGWGWDESISHFNAGKTGMLQLLAEFGNICEDPSLNPDYYDKVDYMECPAGPAGKGNVAGGLGWGANKDTGTPELAYKFIEWAMSPQQMRRTMEADPKAALNARPSLLTDPDLVKKFRWFPVHMEGMKHAWYTPNLTNWFEVIEVIAGRMQEVLIKGKNVKTTLDALQSDLEGMNLPKYGITGYEV